MLSLEGTLFKSRQLSVKGVWVTVGLSSNNNYSTNIYTYLLWSSKLYSSVISCSRNAVFSFSSVTGCSPAVLTSQW